MDPDKEKKHEKKIQKIMKRSAIYVGIGIGFMILIPFLPDIANEGRSEAMKSLFSMTAGAVILYGVLMTAVCLFFRSKAVMFDGLMNFFVVPAYGIWFLMEAYQTLNA